MRHADVLEYLWLLNGAGSAYTYTQLHGDKDTFYVAFELAGKREHYMRVSGWVGVWLVGGG